MLCWRNICSQKRSERSGYTGDGMKNSIRFVRAVFFLAAFAAGGTVPVTTSMAERMSPERTDPNHLSRAPERPKWRMKQVTLPKSTIYENPGQRGLLFTEEKPLMEVSRVDRLATDACRDGRFRRFGGGFVRVGGEFYRAARSRDIRRPRRMKLGPGVYVFRHEGSTRCTVYLVGNR